MSSKLLKLNSQVDGIVKYESGTILIVRTVHYPTIPSSMADEVRPRSICLAEVKWQQELADGNAIQFGMGLRYIEYFLCAREYYRGLSGLVLR